MSKRNAVRVCVRTRPTHQFAQDNIVIDEEHATIQVAITRECLPAALSPWAVEDTWQRHDTPSITPLCNVAPALTLARPYPSLIDH